MVVDPVEPCPTSTWPPRPPPVPLPVYGTVDDLRQVVANGLAAFGGGRLTERLRRWTERSLDRMNRFVDTRPESERDVLLEFLAQVARRYIEKLPR